MAINEKLRTVRTQEGLPSDPFKAPPAGWSTEVEAISSDGTLKRVVQVSPTDYLSNDPDNPITGDSLPTPTLSVIAFGPFTNDGSIAGLLTASVIYDPSGDAIDLT
ncbi:MAG: hypothetical protein RIE56_01485, partial [Amphiplicatus sp.]